MPPPSHTHTHAQQLATCCVHWSRPQGNRNIVSCPTHTHTHTVLVTPWLHLLVPLGLRHCVIRHCVSVARCRLPQRSASSCRLMSVTTKLFILPRTLFLSIYIIYIYNIFSFPQPTPPCSCPFVAT